MTETEAFKEFKQGLALLRDNFADRALTHMQKAAQLEKNNPYYMSYLGVVLARSEEKWAEAEKLCDNAVRLKRNQAQLYLNLAEVYTAAGRRETPPQPSRDPAQIASGAQVGPTQAERFVEQHPVAGGG